jgi:hypothetical protein
MHGPLAQLYALLRSQNDEARSRSPVKDEFLFNSRLSPVFRRMNITGLAPDQLGNAPIDLESPNLIASDPMDPLARMRNPWAADRMPPVMPFRDREQGGPAPPARDTFARLYGKR